MPVYLFPNGSSVVVVSATVRPDGDTLLRLELGAYTEHYLRKPDKAVRNAKQPRWYIELMGVNMPVHEHDVPVEIRQSWVYCYRRTYLAVELDTHYAT